MIQQKKTKKNNPSVNPVRLETSPAAMNRSWLQLFQSDGKTGEMDSHMEALLITAGVCVFSPALVLQTHQTSQLG